MSYGILTVGGISSTSYGIFVLAVNDANVPQRDYTAYSIPGRSRDLHYDNGRYENIDRVYGLYARSESGISAETRMLNFIAALMGLSGYQRITDSLHPDYYKKGEFKGGVEPRFSRFMDGVRFDLTFDCDARKYLLSGESEVDISNTGTGTWKTYTLAGQGTLPAKPILLFSGFSSASNCSVVLKNKTLTVAKYTAGTLVYDCELGDAYNKSTHANLNSYVTVSSGGFPDLSPVTNAFSVKQGATVKIIPNWCKL